MLEKIWEKIQAAPVITLFRHVNPDPDALGSQRGLKRALEHIFPDKQVYALGEMSKDGFEMDQVSPDAVKQSLAILLDTSNRDRIDGKDLYELAADTIRLDHHVKVEDLMKLPVQRVRSWHSCCRSMASTRVRQPPRTCTGH